MFSLSAQGLPRGSRFLFTLRASLFPLCLLSPGWVKCLATPRHLGVRPWWEGRDLPALEATMGGGEAGKSGRAHGHSCSPTAPKSRQLIHRRPHSCAALSSGGSRAPVPCHFQQLRLHLCRPGEQGLSSQSLVSRWDVPEREPGPSPPWPRTTQKNLLFQSKWT